MVKAQEIKLIPITLALVKRLLPSRPRNADKETFGRVFVLAGSRGLTGAAMLCSRSVLRAGAGLAILGVPRSLERLVDVANPEVMTLGLPENRAGAVTLKAYLPVKKIVSKMRVMVMGPGVSRNTATKELIRKILRLLPRKFNKLKIVVDADGLRGLIPFKKVLSTEYLPIITPHTGELARLLKVKRSIVEKQPILSAQKAARKYRVLVVLKGFQTIVVSPYEEEILFNNTGNPGMATGGTGDVLTGTIAGLLAQRMDSWTAAVTGVYIHGLAGNFAAMRLGQDGIIASDVMENLPLALKRIRGK